MDFDDTWHPATHPSGAVLPAVIALSEAFPQKKKTSGLDLLLAFNVGIEVQGRLLRFSGEARNIPKRYTEMLQVESCVEGFISQCVIYLIKCKLKYSWPQSIIFSVVCLEI